MASTADRGGRLASEFSSKGLVAIGWTDAGDTTALETREAFFLRMKEVFPDESKPKQANSGGQLYRFVREMQIGDQVVTYDNARRMYLIGKVRSRCDYDAALLDGEFPNSRKVDWQHEVSRDDLTLKARNTLGSTLTLFKVPVDTVTEMDALAQGILPKPIIAEDEPLEAEDMLKGLQADSQEYIKDRITKLTWDEMQDLVAGVLRAMGYKTRVSRSGPDRGKDIVASRDGFGFEHPRIIVEVKHRREQMGSAEVRSFLSVIRHAGDKGLYVSTGGFSREAYYEAERASNPITLMNLDELVEAILDHYERLDMETRVLLPLRKIYWPA